MSEPYLYEILIRGNAAGQITGAHQVRAVDSKNPFTGEVKTEEHVAEPIDPSMVDDILTASFATLANDIVALRGEQETVCAKHGALEDELARTKQALAEAQSNLGEVQAALKATRGDLGAAQRQVEQLTTDLAAARAERDAATADLAAAKAGHEDVLAERERLAAQASAAAEREVAHGEMEAAHRQAVAEVASVAQERDALAARVAELQPTTNPEVPPHAPGDHGHAEPEAMLDHDLPVTEDDGAARFALYLGVPMMLTSNPPQEKIVWSDSGQRFASEQACRVAGAAAAYDGATWRCEPAAV